MQWWWLSSHLCGGGGKVGTEGGRGSLSVRRREQPGLRIATIRDTKEGNADTMHARVLRDCGMPMSRRSHVDTLDGDYQVEAFAQVSDLLMSGRCLRASPQALAAGFVVRAYAAGHSVPRMGALCGAMCGVSV